MLRGTAVSASTPPGLPTCDSRLTIGLPAAVFSPREAEEGVGPRGRRTKGGIGRPPPSLGGACGPTSGPGPRLMVMGARACASRRRGRRRGASAAPGWAVRPAAILLGSPRAPCGPRAWCGGWSRGPGRGPCVGCRDKNKALGARFNPGSV